MHITTIALTALFSLVAAQEAAPDAATTLVTVRADQSERPEDISQLMKKKCPQQKCGKPKHVTVTKNITKVGYKTITKVACETNNACKGKNC